MSNRIVVIPPYESLHLTDNSIVLLARISESNLKPNYTFSENLLQPTPAVPERGWKGYLKLDILATEQGDFEDQVLSFPKAIISNEYGLPDINVRFSLSIGEEIRVAFEPDNQNNIQITASSYPQ